MKYLLDTCVISDFFKKNETVIKHFEALSPETIHISTVTVMEIEYGLRLNPEREIKILPHWKALLNLIHVVPYSSQCAAASVGIRSHLKKKGLLIGPYDILIAGTSIAYEMIMVTSNMNEFNRIPEITIEDWRN